ncbi:cell cycle checkpoint protein [Suhomyces tanzawaensis NRRL Y-17324]|uniref:Serine/threonine-protein kinase MEC1 n=1 Tax=Suhomyces tanzawaensis NRRL Y-17324 TaxID=984487 RepID=A0A1E4SPW5_9ASCO|nr:cell cycle checkpoint protein [Suhomyces tanzawaensis NRRL Y-17324]ODV81452.1 cell cycle checkpoint protein [Suhomyces tanzawaensis NRRL Y-17324]
MPRIAPVELNQFLDDLELNINNDDNTDFKKLVLFLFSFTSEKLQELAQEPNDPTSIQLLQRLVSALELVLGKRLHLLNLRLTPKDTTSISQELPSASDLPLYEWAIQFTLHHLPSHYEPETLNCLKSFIINIINLVTTKLHNLKYCMLIRDQLLALLQTDLDSLLKTLVNSTGVSLPKLVGTIHLFTILNDYDLSNKLGLNLAHYQLKFESFARKIWFLLNEILPVADSDFVSKLQDLKSLLILNQADNLVLNDMVTWNQISFLISWIVEILNAPTTGNTETTLSRTISTSLLKIFNHCLEKGIIDSLIHFPNFSGVLYNLCDQHRPNTHPFPPTILKTLHIINYCYRLAVNDKILINSYQTSTLNQFLIVPFGEIELDGLRARTLDHFGESKTHQISELLFYMSDNGTDVSNLNSWIQKVQEMLKNDSTCSKLSSLHMILSAMSHFPCLVSNDYNFQAQECTKCGTRSMNKNPYEVINTHRKTVFEKNEISVFYNVICQLLASEKRSIIEKNPVLGCDLLLSIFSLFSSYAPPIKGKDLSSDIIFRFLIQMLLQNNNREVRLIVTRILPLYLVQPESEQTETSFKIIFKQISSIEFSTDERRHFGESTIKAFVELAIISGGERLCILFIKLIDLLGENNDQHVNYVYNGFLQIASAKSLAPYKLLSPYLPSIAEVIIKKTRILNRITELLGITKKFFLNRTKEYTTPRLLEYYKADFIQEIAEAAGISKSDLIKKNLPRIIATYLVKDATINEKYIINVLSNINPKYKQVTLGDLISRVGEITWFILLQIQIDSDSKQFLNEERILNALKYVAKIAIKQKRLQVKDSNFDYIQHHLGENVLELVQKFSENVHHITGTKPFLEKISSLRAIEFLINKNIKAVTTALGQISTCLQASLENPDFQYLALECWFGLVQNLPPNHLISLIDIVISLIFQKFNSFEYKSKLIAVEILKKIYEGIKNKYTRYSLYYLSIPFLDSIQKYMPISDFKITKHMSRLSIFQEFTRRLKTSNEYVVQQALQDLLNYCQEYQANCQAEYFRDPLLEPSISELVRTVLDTASKFKNRNELISTNCAKVLSTMGSLDFNKFNFKSVKSQIIVIQDFKDYRENSEFLIDFIENMVLKIFWSSNNPIKQLFSAYAIQKFLEILNLNDVMNPNKTSQDHLIAVWNRFNEVSKSTLIPLLNSKYVAPISRFEPLGFPYFKIHMKFEVWLVDFTSNLLRRPLKSVFDKTVPPTKETIFETCSKLIKDQDISLCHYLLKYVALSHIMNGNDEVILDVKKEFMEILNADIRSASGDRMELLKNCYHTIFEVLDYFHAWVSSATQYLNNSALDSQELSRFKKHIKYVNIFLDYIPMDLIAMKSSQCDSYERTILYLEKCYRSGRVEDSIISSTLQSMYANINDFDALNGVLKKFSTNNLTEKLRTFQYHDNWSLAQESFQVICNSEDQKFDNIENNTKLLKSLSDHGLYEEVLSNLAAKSDLINLTSIPLDWSMVGLQASVQAGDINQINKWILIASSIGKPKDVETQIGFEFAKGIKFLFEGKNDGFERCMESMYRTIGSSLVSSISSSFSRNTYLMNQLHAIYDFSLMVAPQDELRKKDNERILKARLENMDQGFDLQWKILTLHQVANKILKNKSKISELLLYCSSLARRNQRLDVATRSTIKAMVLDDQNANIEYANLLWAQGKQTEAIKSLSEIIVEYKFKNDEAKAQAQLQYAKWLDESNHSSSLAIINEYSKTIELDNRWEKPYYDLGVYYSKIMESTKDQSGYYEQQTVRNFSKALAVGNLYIFEALPKSITIWLDFAQRRSKTREAERKLNQIVEDIDKCLTTIPAYVWYTAITQLLSRIVHEHKPSYEKLAAIISNIIKTYPNHSLWYVLSHSLSNDSVRRERVNTILKKVKNDDSSYGVTIENAKELFNSLIKIANFKIPKSPRAKRLSLEKDFKVTNLSNPYTSLVIPVRSNLEIRLPSIQTSKFNAFPRSASITFDGFDDIVNIFYSLQMPRQVTIRGSDNQPYRLMVKRDDTRKDAKVVEFTTMINRLLLSSTEARKRKLVISNYSVVALAENMGVIEFVADVQTMKSIISEQRRKMGLVVNERKIFMKLDEAQKMVKSSKSSDLQTLNNLTELFKSVCEENSPVLHNWYIDQFSDPSAWYLARNSFIRSSSVMSIVGYIIGLGDRHCENILFFRKNGSVLHIDFDCLFDKGSTLPTPEIVPFRLTQNMVDAMGVCGIEGGFRITCEVTGSILRENEAPLMNILETLLYDPLLDWKSLQKPETHLSKVRRKLRGLVNEKEGLPMNIHGQVDILIQEATSVERLSQMYGGWAPYI